MVPVILQGKSMLGGRRSALSLLPFSRESVLSPSSPLPRSRGHSYGSTDRPSLRSPLLQLLLDCRGKNGDSVGRHMKEAWGELEGMAPLSSDLPMGTVLVPRIPASQMVQLRGPAGIVSRVPRVEPGCGHHEVVRSQVPQETCHHLVPQPSLPVTTALAPGSQVHLHVGPEVLVDVALQVDGQVWDAKDGPLHVHQPLFQPA